MMSPRRMRASQLAAAMHTSGDEDQAARLADEAEALAMQLTDLRWPTRIFGGLAELAAAGCDYDRAERLIAQILEPSARAGALGQLAEAVTAGCDHDRAAQLVNEAEALTAEISNPHQQAEALARVAVTLRRLAENTTPEQEQLHRSSPALVRSRSLFAEALAIGSWSEIFYDLAQVDPAAFSALADELEVRWKLDAPGGPGDNTEHRCEQE